MFSSIIRRSITCTTLARFYVSLAGNNYVLASNRRSKDSVLQCITLKNNAISHRYISNQKNDLTKCLPLLPGRVYKSKLWASIMSGFVKDLLNVTLINEKGSINEVIDCMKTVACNVSMELVNKNYDYLVGLMEEDPLELLQKKVDSLTDAQRNLIAIREEDIKRYNLVHITSKQRMFQEGVTIETRLAIFYKPRHGQIQHEEEEDDGSPDNLKLPDELVANYAFSREYTKSGTSDWIISYINLDTSGIF